MASGLTLGAMAEIFNLIPTMFLFVQIVVYVFSILFFGSIAVRGYRGYLTRRNNLIMRIVLGAICVVTGISISPLLQIDNPLFRLMQLDMLLGMLISSVVLMASVRLMSLYIPYSIVIKEKIKRLQESLDKRKDKDAVIPQNHIKNPATIIGIVLFVGFIAFALLNFHGFPDMRSSVFSTLGMNESDWASLTNSINQLADSPISRLSTGCMSAIEEMQGRTDVNESVFINSQIKSMIETNSGKTVLDMYKLERNGKVLIDADVSGGKHCFATMTEFCICS